MSRSGTDLLARKRATLILQVRAGQLTAKEAARQLGLSRQRYYQWEQRALKALLHALADQPRGRPKARPDPNKSALQVRVNQLQARLRHYEQKEKVRAELKKLEEQLNRSSAKKNPKSNYD